MSHPAVHLAAAPAAPATTDEQICALVALHAAASDPDVTCDVPAREELRADWAAHLKVIRLRHDPDFALAYLPSLVITQTVCFAVHLATGTVFDPDPSLSTSAWVAWARTLVSD